MDMDMNTNTQGRKEALRRIKEAKPYVAGKRKYTPVGSYPLVLVAGGETLCVECELNQFLTPELALRHNVHIVTYVSDV